MRSYKKMTALLLAFFASTLVAFANNDPNSQDKRYNPFTEEFLKVCGRLALSGDLPKGEIGGVGRQATRHSFLNIHSKGEHVFCGFFAVYHSSVLGMEDAGKLEYQPWWLRKSDLVDRSFASWIDQKALETNFLPNVSCLGILKSDNPVDKVLYSRAVSIEETGRVIAVEMVRRLNSYIEPDRGYKITLFAWTANDPAECATRKQ